MNKNFLDEYHAKEWEHLMEFHDDVMRNGLEKAKPYPYNNRFFRPQQPLIRAEQLTIQTDCEKIWSQIPFSGSLIITLIACSEKNFPKLHGFEISDIPKLIELSKETGKVQFTLQSYPTQYENLEHMNTIFTEVLPPVSPLLPTESMVDIKQFGLWKEEFHALAEIKYGIVLAKNITNMYESERFLEHLLDHSAEVYARLKILGMSEEVEMLSNLMIDDPKLAYTMFDKYFVLLTPKFDGLKAGNNVSLNRMKQNSISSNLDYKKITFPVEVGKNIMKKLVQHPTSYQGCIEVIENYKSNDLYDLLIAMDNSAKSQNLDLFRKSTKELDQILDNVWNDANKINMMKDRIRDGISVAIAIVGGFASNFLVNHEGILAGGSGSMF